VSRVGEAVIFGCVLEMDGSKTRNRYLYFFRNSLLTQPILIL
jgi:hypothetical protein